MSKLFKSKFLLGVMTVAIMFVGAVTISAETASADCSITHTLRVGSIYHSEVMCLQTAVGVVADGSFGPKTKAAVMAWQASVGLVADGVFGPKSNAAWMASVPPVATGLPAGCVVGGLFSSTTGLPCAASAGLPAGCTSTAGYSPTTGKACNGAAGAPAAGLSGVGNITSTTLNGSPSNVQVGEGSQGVAVLGFQVRADAGSNLNIQNVRVNLLATGTGSTWPSRYISGISVWQGATKVGAVSVSQLSQNGTTYSATVTLTGATVAANSTSDFSVSVDANTSIDSGDAGNVFNVSVDSIRYSDQSGAILTASLTGIVQPMRFLKLSSSASTKIVLSEDAGNPRDRTVVTNYTSSTNDVPLLKFGLAAQGSDMIITKIALPATATGVTTTAGADGYGGAAKIATYYKLKYNGSVVSAFTIQATTTSLTPTITFGDTTVAGSTSMNGGVGQIVIKAGTTGAFEVDADVKAMCNGVSTTSPCTAVVSDVFSSGDSLKVDFSSGTLQSAVAVQDQTGSSLGTTSTNRTGSATGYPATFRVQGVTASYVGNTFGTPVTNTTTSVTTAQTFNTTVTVAAVGNDFFINPVANYVPNTAFSTTQDGAANTAFGFNVAVLNGSNNQYTTTTEVTAASVALSVTCTSGCIQQSLTSMKIPSGTTATFVIQTTLTDSTSIAAGQYKLAIFSTNATDGTTLSAFTNTPAYAFITPQTPLAFQ